MNDPRRARLLMLLWREFDDELVDLRALHERMRVLQRHLLAHLATEVQQSNAELAELFTHFEARAARRVRILQALSIESGPAAVPRLIGEAPVAQRVALTARWHAIGQLARECRDLNARNGRILATQRDLLAHVLRAVDAPLVYAPPHP